MIKRFLLKTGGIFLLIIVINILFRSPALAVDPCDEIIYLNGSPKTVVDCNDPFMTSSEATAFTLNINGIEVADRDTISIENPTPSDLNMIGNPRLSIATHALFLHDGDDYRELEFYDGSLSLEYGTYTLVTNDFELVFSQNNALDKWLSFLIPVAHAQAASYRYSITFTLVEDSIEPEIDPLILQYAPVLYMHPDEDYFPMDVETFITESALWDQSGVDTQLYDASELTTETFDAVIQNDATDNYYLAYSDPDNEKSIDLDVAKVKYGNPDENNVTVYTHRMEDSFTDSLGADHDFIVLQYWFFYAMNNWKEHGGFNNHEGDWESVFIFLDKDTETPKYIAYSAHHNDGENEFGNLFQYDSVRRGWGSEEVVKDDGQIVSFVALGSHANYPNNGGGSHTVPYPDPVPDQFDLTSKNSVHVESFSSYIDFNISDNKWSEYEGKWGTDGLLSGTDGPQGPNFTEVSGYRRFEAPIEWAGIDTIFEVVTVEPVSSVVFDEQGVIMNFINLLSAGTLFSISPHIESISFGLMPDNVTLLPEFWDIESSLINGDFTAEVSFSFNPTQVETFGVDESNLAVFFYNPSIDTWEIQSSVVDASANTVTFITDHFSRYALGVVIPNEELTLSELFDELRGEIKETDLRKYKKYFLLRKVNLIEYFIDSDRRYSERIAVKLLKRLERRVRFYERKDILNGEESSNIKVIMDEIKQKLSK